MPCRDYDSDSWGSNGYSEENRKLKNQNDRLARVACKAMTELVKSGYADFLLLQDDEVREWWDKHQEADRKEQARLAEIERRNKIKADALAKLSNEEKEILGIKTPKGSSAKQVKLMQKLKNQLNRIEDEEDE